jgi:hypothetical protein
MIVMGAVHKQIVLKSWKIEILDTFSYSILLWNTLCLQANHRGIAILTRLVLLEILISHGCYQSIAPSFAIRQFSNPDGNMPSNS